MILVSDIIPPLGFVVFWELAFDNLGWGRFSACNQFFHPSPIWFNEPFGECAILPFGYWTRSKEFGHLFFSPFLSTSPPEVHWVRDKKPNRGVLLSIRPR